MGVNSGFDLNQLYQDYCQNAMQQVAQTELGAQHEQYRAMQNIGANPAQQANTTPSYHTRARELLINRLCGVKGDFYMDQKEFLWCHVYDEQVYVFYAFKDSRVGHLEEGVSEFPSDTIITQIRLLKYS